MSATLTESDWLGDVTPTRSPGGRPAKGYRGRQRKLECESCGFIVYATAGAVERAGGRPTCVCGGSMHWANERDRLVIEPHELLDEIGTKRFRALCFEHGWRDLAKNLAPTERELVGDRGGPNRCQWEGGYCSRFTSGRFCREHEQLSEVTSAYRRVA